MTQLAATVRGTGPRVVLLHGFTQTARSWDRLAATLATRHEVVTVDLPGHGDSADVELGLEATADVLAAQFGTASYVGYSLGGRHAVTLALRHPGSVDRLVLLGATAGIEDREGRDQRLRSDAELVERLQAVGVDRFLDQWLANPMFAGLPVDEAGRTDRLRNTVSGLAASLRLAGTGTQRPAWDELHRLEMPVLVLAGEHDEKFVGLGRRMAAAIGANARFETVTDAGHAAHLEQPERFDALVQPFLAGSGAEGQADRK